MATIRQQLRIPKYGLFYFDSDQSLSIVPVSKIKNIIEGDRKTAGSLVELYYGSLLLKAEIIAVDGKCLLFFFKYSTARLLAHSLNKTAGEQRATPARQNVVRNKNTVRLGLGKS